MSRTSVLVVEDNEDLRTHFSASLSVAGFLVHQAADGLEALRMLDASPPDIIVLDLGLPLVSGQDVLFELKEHSCTRQIPVVVVSGSDAVEGVSPECFLRKPVQAVDLIHTVQRCLDRAARDSTSLE